MGVPMFRCPSGTASPGQFTHSCPPDIAVVDGKLTGDGSGHGRDSSRAQRIPLTALSLVLDSSTVTVRCPEEARWTAKHWHLFHMSPVFVAPFGL